MAMLLSHHGARFITQFGHYLMNDPFSSEHKHAAIDR
jgi:hypothetical protein